MNVTKTIPPVGTQVYELAATIRKRIQNERLEDGEFFMTEAQLATEYGVSRTVTREAVSRLQAIGLLEGRKRKGLIVRRPDPLRLFQNSLPSFVTSPDDWRDLAQLRYSLEVGSIELAIEAATDEQLACLTQIERSLEAAVQQDLTSAAAVDLDLKFHSYILEMTGSRMIAGMQHVLAQFFQIIPLCPHTPESVERICRDHRELLDAICARDVERARAIIREQNRATLAMEGFKVPSLSRSEPKE